MIITRTPFRITLGGGGTDLPSYYSEHGGFIFSAAIDKYMFITLNRPALDASIKIKYSQLEAVSQVKDLRHDIARETLRFEGIEKNVDINSIGDIPAGSGLGSSSCYAVGLLNAIHALKKEKITPAQLAEEDFNIEANILKRPIGKQDPYLAAFGGFTVLEIAKDGQVEVRRARISKKTADELNQNMLLFFTHVTRSADDILAEQTKSVKEENKSVLESMHYIKELGREILKAAEEGDADEIGRKFHAHWQYKKQISKKMSNPEFDRIYNAAIKNGALGGKISGAGGGGFFTFYVPQGQPEFREVMNKFGLREMRYRFEPEGSKVLANFSGEA